MNESVGFYVFEPTDSKIVTGARLVHVHKLGDELYVTELHPGRMERKLANVAGRFYGPIPDLTTKAGKPLAFEKTTTSPHWK